MAIVCTFNTGGSTANVGTHRGLTAAASPIGHITGLTTASNTLASASLITIGITLAAHALRATHTNGRVTTATAIIGHITDHTAVIDALGAITILVA